MAQQTRQNDARSKPALRVLQGERIVGMTCFAAHEKHGVDCTRKSCDMWLERAKHSCVLISAKDGERTLHEIGQMFTPTLSRMRICQLVNGIYEKIRQAS